MVTYPGEQYCRGDRLPGVLYCAESISLGYGTPGSHSWPRGFNSHFFTLLHGPLKGQRHKNKWWFLFYFQHEAVGTTVPIFFVFFAVLWMHATLLIIVRLCSNLRCWIVHGLSFLEKKTELIYLHYRPFYSCSSIVFNFLAKKTPKNMCALLKNQNLFSTYFLNGKLYWKNSNGFKLQSLDSLSCKKWHKLNIRCLCTVKKIKN